MASITFKGTPIHTSGTLPQPGETAPDFSLTTNALEDVSLSAYEGKRKILNVVPSLDTGVCAASARQFNERIKSFPNTVVLTVSRDLPFAQSRFCEVSGIDEVVALSELRNRNFGSDYGIEMTDGPLTGLLGRAVIVLDENNKVVHTELVPEIAQEPDYQAALNALT
jgi:thioredoxin-dependent peroxiredoxin